MSLQKSISSIVPEFTRPGGSFTYQIPVYDQKQKTLVRSNSSENYQNQVPSQVSYQTTLFGSFQTPFGVPFQSQVYNPQPQFFPQVFKSQFQYQPKSNKETLLKIPSKKIIERKPIISVLGIGDPIVDISSEIEEKSIINYGLEWGRTVMADEKSIGIFNEIERSEKISYIPGGSVQNTMRVISWCLEQNQMTKGKFKISMLGCVGDDTYAEKIKFSLNSARVNPLLEELKNQKTSRCGVGIFHKERCLVTELNASKLLSEEFVSKKLDEILEHQALVIEGYILQSKLNICRKLCELFNKQNKLVVLTLSAVFMIQFHYEKVFEIANMADIIVGNMEEAQAFAQIQSQDKDDILKAIHEKFSKDKDRKLLITDGKKGVYYSEYDYENHKLDYEINCFPNIVPNNEIEDLNGAGDAFLGGFLSEYIQGSDIVTCCKVGNEAAGIIIRCVGCTFPKKK